MCVSFSLITKKVSLYGTEHRVNTVMHIGWEHEMLANIPVDLKTRKYTDTSCQIEIHSSIQIIKYNEV